MPFIKRQLSLPIERTVVAIDPGPEESAYVAAEYRPGVYPKLFEFGYVANDKLLELLPKLNGLSSTLAVEMIASYGMAVGATVFETCVWIGRYIQAWPGAHFKVYRRDVKLYLCGQPRAKDPNIRQALIDKFGPSPKRAIGTAKAPGPLYGVSGDVWAALGVAVTFLDTQPTGRR